MERRRRRTVLLDRDQNELDVGGSFRQLHRQSKFHILASVGRTAGTMIQS